jgi:formylglycine-generating enzyme required for sulfatase activity
MALLHSFRGKLPEDRTELYADAVDLLLRRWEQRISDEAGLIEQLDIPGLKISDLEAGLYDVAFRAHTLAGEDHGTADIEESDLRKWLAPYLGGSWDKAGEFVSYIRERAGLLVRHKTEAYTFPHRTFQEFMAACHLVGMPDYVNEAARLVREDLVRWREVFVLAAGHAARTHRLGQAIAAVNALVPRAVAEVNAPISKAYLEAELAGEALQEIGLVGVRRQEAGQAVLSRVQQWLVTGMRADAVLEPSQRADIGNVLVPLGDPRFRADAWYLPDEPLLGFVEIPAGPFLMGSDPSQDRNARDREQPQHERMLSTYYIARYPVTVVQFRAFVQASGHKPDTERCLEGVDNHPVVDVTWHDAIVYCRWLTERLQRWHGTPEPLAALLREKDWVMTLPSEAQWEKSARGPFEDGNPGRIFPWGNESDFNRANCEMKIDQTSAVGCFPGGASPYGIEDLSGNVYEWTWTQWQENYEEYQLDLSAENRAVLRGGTFYNYGRSGRCASRNHYNPRSRRNLIGFRLVCGGPRLSALQR